MKIIPLYLFVAVSFSLSARVSGSGLETTDYGAATEQVRVYAKTLEKEGVWGFVATADANGWTAPHIHSAHFVHWIPAAEVLRSRYEWAKRDFGFELVKALDIESLKIVDPASTQEREMQIERLLSFSHWIGGARGFGNFALKMRAENLSCIPLGHLIADLDYPTDKIEKLLSRQFALKDRLRFQIEVLNEEAPDTYTMPGLANWEEGLEKQWRKRMKRAYDLYEDEWAKHPDATHPAGMIPRKYSFYFDNQDNFDPFSLTTFWVRDLRFHICIRGRTDPVSKRLHNFLLFRKAIGKFPLKPTRPLGSFPGEEIQEGFYEAWQPYEDKLGIHPGASGYTYREIRENRFFDYDTQNLVRHLKRRVFPDTKEFVARQNDYVPSSRLIREYRDWLFTNPRFSPEKK